MTGVPGPDRIQGNGHDDTHRDPALFGDINAAQSFHDGAAGEAMISPKG